MRVPCVSSSARSEAHAAERRPLAARAARRRRWWLAIIATSALGCGTEFDPGSEVQGLRVLAIKKSSPYARPGERVELEMLWHDASAPRAGQPVPEIAWLALCENPPGDLFEQCFAQFPTAAPEDLADRLSLPEPGATSANDRFAFTVSPDIISSRPPPADRATIPYGLNFVFFAACAGRLFQRDDPESFPLGCYEELDGEPGLSAGDRQLDSRSFVVGYTAVFAYAELSNANPIVRGIQIGGVTLWPEAAAAEAPPGAVLAAPSDMCIGSACLDGTGLDGSDGVVGDCPPALTLPACTEECDEVSVRPLIDPSSAEVDQAASRRGGTALGEQMWVNYYATGGEVGEEVRLLNDATLGWNENFATDFRPAPGADGGYLWAVAHDNRGGSEWVRARLCTDATSD